MIGHCDCNNFYVSCFRVFMPELMGRPVGVLSSGDGCIVARSNELKALGVANGTPVFQLPQAVRRRTVLLSSAYPLFGECSRRVVATMQAFTGPVEQYSIDEQFIDMSGLSLEALQAHSAELRQQVQRCTGIPVSIGVAASRTLAKVAAGCLQWCLRPRGGAPGDTGPPGAHAGDGCVGRGHPDRREAGAAWHPHCPGSPPGQPRRYPQAIWCGA